MAKKTLTDEELVEELREKGHEQAAVALERKLSGQRVVAANVPAAPPENEISRSSSVARIERGYALGDDPTTIRRRRRNQEVSDVDRD